MTSNRTTPFESFADGTVEGKDCFPERKGLRRFLFGVEMSAKQILYTLGIEAEDFRE